MSLSSLGRNVIIAQSLTPLVAPESAGDDAAQLRATAVQFKETADEKIASARKSILDALTPWIPGDFVVTYGVLLTAWTTLRASFEWMLLIAGVLTLIYVPLGAFSENGFKNIDAATRRLLLWRTIVGFVVSILASIAIPNSGWYDIEHFSRHELSWLVTAGILVGAIVFALKGIQKRSGLALAGK